MPSVMVASGEKRASLLINRELVDRPSRAGSPAGPRARRQCLQGDRQARVVPSLPMQLPDVPVASCRMPIDGDRMAPSEPFWLRAKYALLTRDRRQQIRLAQSALANLLMLACVAILHVLDTTGLIAHGWVTQWTVDAVGGMVAVFVLIRSGRVMHWRDPSLTMEQMLYAILCSAVGYHLTGPMRAIVIPILAVVLMFGMFGMTQRQMRIVGVYTVAVFGAVSLHWLWRGDAGEPAGAELARLMMIMIIVAGVVALTGRLHGMRERSRAQREALTNALERIRELATRDELTGCLNRRAMHERLADEARRCARHGTPMCVALIDLDHFKDVNDLHGHAAGDRLLRTFGELARARLRVGDWLARWGGEEFLLLLTATDAAQARPCVQRVLEALDSPVFAEIAPGLAVTASAGLAECRPGDSVTAAIERADAALYRAKNAGRNRLMCG